MELHAVEKFLRKRLEQPLPGPPAHALMRARPMEGLLPSIKHKLPPRTGSVLIMLYQDGRDVMFPLIQRQPYKGIHGGQVSLPGGKTEPGEDLMQTALRETEEEIGVPRTEPRVIGALSDFLVTPSNFLIRPVVAVIDSVPVYKPDPYEVASVLTASVQSLLLEDAIAESEVIASGNYRMLAPHFIVQGTVVWGATSMIINELRMLLREMPD